MNKEIHKIIWFVSIRKFSLSLQGHVFWKMLANTGKKPFTSIRLGCPGCITLLQSMVINGSFVVVVRHICRVLEKFFQESFEALSNWLIEIQPRSFGKEGMALEMIEKERHVLLQLSLQDLWNNNWKIGNIFKSTILSQWIYKTVKNGASSFIIRIW